jgi:hypothetical protein
MEILAIFGSPPEFTTILYLRLYINSSPEPRDFPAAVSSGERISYI